MVFAIIMAGPIVEVRDRSIMYLIKLGVDHTEEA